MLSEKPWRVDAVVILLARLLVCLSAGVLAISALLSKDAAATASGQYLQLILSAISLQGSALLLTALFLREHNVGWREAFGFSTRLSGGAVVLAAGAALFMVPVAGYLNSVIAWLMEHAHVTAESQQAVQTLQATHAPGERIFFALITVLCAPLVEEMLFRGIIYPTVKQYYSATRALWGTSLLFALVHFNVASFLPLTLFAVVLTLLYERTNNLLAPMMTHSVFNLVNFLFVIYGDKLEKWLPHFLK